MDDTPTATTGFRTLCLVDYKDEQDAADAKTLARNAELAQQQAIRAGQAVETTGACGSLASRRAIDIGMPEGSA